MKVKTRFAPSPTGLLHIGGLRSALFAFLYAKKMGGRFLLRIEDTDQERLFEGGVENILNSLYWAGIVPDEGVVLKNTSQIEQTGENGPYIQSQRLSIYQEYVDKLISTGYAYRCFCSKERLEQLRKDQEAAKKAPGYDGCCRQLADQEINNRLAEGQKYVVRMKMPKTGNTKFTDLVRGEVEFANDLIDDQVILKADGFPTYHLAVVVDDHLMGITHVIRGEEWLPSTPKHIHLYQMLGWDMPQFAHLSLLLNDQKQKLSKRHGDVSVRDYIDKGYLPEALINFIAFLGWNPGDEREVFSLSELINEFSFDKVAKSAAVFNLEKLNWYNGQYIRSLNIDDLLKRSLPFLIKTGLINEKTMSDSAKIDKLKKAINMEKNRVEKLADLPDAVGFVFADVLKYDAELLIWKKNTKSQTSGQLAKLADYLADFPGNQWMATVLQSRVGEWIKENNLTNGEVLWPMRVSLSGQKNSPSPFEIAEVLGKDKTIARIKSAIKLL